MTDETTVRSAEQKRALLAQLLREKAAKSKTTVPMSYGQRALWFIQQLAPENTAYHIAFSARIRSTVDVAALKRALQVLTNRHPVLRTVFPIHDGIPVQAIQPYRDVSFEQVAASGWDDKSLYEHVLATHRLPFDFQNSPPIRWHLFSRAENDHVLLMTVHHIIFDNWSNWIIMDELRQAYQMEASNQPLKLSPVEKQFADFVEWQNGLLDSAEGEKLKAYWTERLQGAATELNLPTDRVRPPLQTFNGALVEFRLNDSVLSALHTLAKAEGTTLYMLLLAAYQVLLYRYTGQEDILVGSPTSGRTRAEFSSIVGYFVNPVVMRGQLSDQLSFREFLKQVRQTVLDALANQDYPFILVVEETVKQRDFSRSPLFQVMFNFLKIQRAENTFELLLSGQSDAQADFGGLLLEPYLIPQEEGQFDMALEMFEVGDIIRGTLKYNTDLFDASTIERFLSNFVTLLEAIVAHPEQTITELPILTATERRQVLVGWNDTAAEYPQDAVLPQMFEAQVERTPNAVAMIFGDEQLTYRELNMRANQLAHYLHSLGVGNETLVGVSMERSLDLIVALLGILKAGGAYVPLDPHYPQDRLAFIMEDTGLGVVLTQARVAANLPPHEAQVVVMDSDWATIAAQSQDNLPLEANIDNLAYMIYTSGSTGRPKGVMACHRGAINRFSWMWQTYPYGQGEVNCQKTSLNFVDAVWENFGALLQGVPTVVIPDDVGKDPIGLIEMLSANHVTRITLVPSLLRAMLDSGRIALLHGLKYWITSGEALSVELLKRFREALPNCVLINLYGSSEVAADVTYFDAKDYHDQASVPIGKPIANSQIYLVDSQMRPVPVGAAGELLVGGAGLARGYLNRPELTAEKFVPNPFSDDLYARLYKTGDLARYLSDGTIEYVGRIDHQIKLRGFRIELGEVETAMAEYPAVKEALVTLREDTPGDPRLVAYVVGSADFSSADLRTYLRAKLPDYMVPAAFVVLDAMPLTPNGKVNRLALPVPDVTERESERGFVNPRTPVEESIAAIWADVLSVERVGVYDNFFDLGGHSLKATQVVARLRDVFGVDIPVRSLLDQPTMADLSQAVEERLRGTNGKKAENPIALVSREGKIQLSSAQERMWLIDRMMDTGAAYSIPAVVRLNGKLNIEALERSLTEIVRRHEVLRTTYHEADDGVEQRIAEPGYVSIPVSELENATAAKIENWVQEETERAFDLAEGSLVRARLLRLNADDHVLVLNMHHIVSDGWSMGVLVREFTALYAAYAAGEESPLAELPIQYADFAAWQREALSDAGLAEDMAYWTKHLGGGLPVLSLPTDRPRPAIQTFPGAAHRFQLSREMMEGLKGLTRREKGTLFMTLLAAFKVLMWRYSGQEDVIVGTPIANRQRAEIEGLIGFFVNTLALRTDLSGDPSFAELVKRVREVALGAYAHQNMPFEKLVEVLKPERSVSYSPIFQVMFVLQNAPMGTAELPELTVTPLEFDVGAAKFDLTLTMWEENGGMTGQIEYNTDLFDPITMEQLGQHFVLLLESAIAQPNTPISALNLLSGEERQHILLDWNRTAVDYPQDVVLHQLFEAQVERTPDAVAVIFEDQHLTYRELNARANQLARHLRGLGVGADTMVGVSMERSLEMVISLYAILKAGGAYVPMDPEYPPARLAYMLQDSNVPVLLTQERVVASLPEHRAKVISLDMGWDAIAQESSENLPITIQPDNLAYMIYTSGSTGNPKGAMNAHRGIVNRLLWMQDAFKLDASDRVLQKTPFSFDVSVWEFFWTLFTGAQLVVARPGGHRDPAYLVNLIVERGITTLHFVPSMLELFIKEAGIEACTSIRRVICSGEALPLELQNRFFERMDTELHNLYGPTEAAVDVTWWVCQPNSSLRVLPIGQPIANTQMYILDKHMEPVPVGVGGELFIAGIQVGKGYLNRSELTAEKFIADPFSSRPGAKLYRTGDLARYLRDGNIEYLGRIDFQIKLRGFRIELGEIEAALAQYPGVRESLVMLREDTPGDKRLVGYLVTNAAPTVSDLRAHLKDKLPDYMVPAAFVILDSMPLSPNGKADRKALPKPDATRPGSERGFVNPRTPVEESIAAIWADVLGVERVGVYDDFFDLGGHSLKATQVVARLRDVFGVDVPIRTLLDQPLMMELAQFVEEQLHGTNGQAIDNHIALISREGKVPLSFAQERMWIIDQMMDTGAAYSIPAVVRLKGKLNIEALERSLTEIVRRHEVLRTTYYRVDGRVEQKIAEPAPVSIPIWELEDGQSFERDGQLEAWVRDEIQRAFDLAEEPLVRARLLRLSNDEHIMVLNMHHIVSDGWSIGVLVREFTALYAAYAAGEESPLTELPIQYADFAAWQREALSDAGLAEDTAYWTKHLGGTLPVLSLPTDRPRPAVPTFSGAVHRFQLSRELTDGLKGVSRREKATLFMTLLAAFKVLMWRYSGQEDVIVGTPIANRQRAEIEGLIGFFVNTLALRTDLSGNPSFAELVKWVREVALGAYAHQNMPFEKLVEVLKPERSVSYSPIFQVMFVLQNAPTGTSELPELTVTPLEFDVGAAKFDLTLTMWEENGGMIGQIEYNTDLFEHNTMERLEQHFGMLLESAIAQPNTPISALRLLTDEEQQQLLVDWNRTAVDYPRDAVLHQLFEAQVERTPDAVAVICGQEQWSYGELNARANQIAHYLRDLGIGPDVLVGVSMGRSNSLMAVLFGILKAGGAYLPLDPSYPQERLAYMLEDSQATTLITESRFLDLFPDYHQHILCVDRDADKLATQPDANLVNQARAHHLVYVIYTSGSTGRPKGIQIVHQGLTNYLTWCTEAYNVQSGKGAIVHSSISFDLTITGMYPPLLVGRSVYLVPDDSSIEALSRTLLDVGGFSLVKITPAHLELLNQLVPPEKAAGLTQVFVIGGENLLSETVAFWRKAAPDTVLINEYGPTETVVGCSIYQVTDLAHASGSIPIGRPIANTELYVLDPYLNLVPVGVAGELYIGGDGLARGYLNRPDLTAEKFVAHPFNSQQDARLYKTGDLARYLPDGTLEYLGRIDNQVKLRGYRIELGEIEAALAQSPDVREAVVLLREDSPGNKRLVAYLAAEASLSISDLRSYLKNRLPEYMLPSAFVLLDVLPLTPNGKVDRKALPKPEYGQTEREQAVAAPQTATEQVVLEVWQAVLGFEQIGIYDNFFDLGGHSLQAIEVVGKLAEKTGIKLDPTTLRFQTLGQLAASYDEQLAKGIAPAAPEPESESGLAQKLFKAFRRGGK